MLERGFGTMVVALFVWGVILGIPAAIVFFLALWTWRVIRSRLSLQAKAGLLLAGLAVFGIVCLGLVLYGESTSAGALFAVPLVLYLGGVAWIIIGILAGPLWLTWLAWRKTTPANVVGRSIAVVACLLVYSGYVAIYRVLEYNSAVTWEDRVLARVPAPLEAARVEFEYTVDDGVGLPGDATYGLYVYRLTDFSGAWVRARGDKLASLLDGGTARWKSTPVDRVAEREKWYTYDDPPVFPPSIGGYLGNFGFEIPMSNGLEAQIDNSLQTSGSVYTYIDGGVMVVDPARGAVYFFYH